MFVIITVITNVPQFATGVFLLAKIGLMVELSTSKYVGFHVRTYYSSLCIIMSMGQINCIDFACECLTND